MSKSKWLPIESAPKDGTRVLLTDGSEIVCAGWRTHINGVLGWVLLDSPEDSLSVTFEHATLWQPAPSLPEPPES